MLQPTNNGFQLFRNLPSSVTIRFSARLHTNGFIALLLCHLSRAFLQLIPRGQACTALMLAPLWQA